MSFVIFSVNENGIVASAESREVDAGMSRVLSDDEPKIIAGNGFIVGFAGAMTLFRNGVPIAKTYDAVADAVNGRPDSARGLAERIARNQLRMGIYSNHGDVITDLLVGRKNERGLFPYAVSSFHIRNGYVAEEPAVCDPAWQCVGTTNLCPDDLIVPPADFVALSLDGLQAFNEAMVKSVIEASECFYRNKLILVPTVGGKIRSVQFR